jgi:O-acetylserine/cysteine efflux transporter
MPLAHSALALLIAAVWGFNFVTIKLGLEGMPPLLFCGLRFAIAALPLLFLRGGPPVAWRYVIGIGLALGVVKFGLLFTAIKIGMGAGLASLLMQSQVFFTILAAAVLLGERVTPVALLGMLISAGGLALLAMDLPLGTSLIGFGMVILAAMCWAVSNILTKKSGSKDAFRLISWVSLVPPLPLFVLSLLIEGPEAIVTSVTQATPLTVLSLLYVAGPSTILAFAAWSWLLQRHSAAKVTPFALAVPIFGLLSAALFLGEELDAMTLFACGLVFAGLALAILGPSLKLGRALRPAA